MADPVLTMLPGVKCANITLFNFLRRLRGFKIRLVSDLFFLFALEVFPLPALCFTAVP